MRQKLYASTGRLGRALLTGSCLLWATTSGAQPVMEHLGRGLVIVRTAEASAYVGWRLLGTDPAGVGFNLYRAAGAGRPIRLNKTPLMKTADFIDTTLNPALMNSYTVRAVVGGKEIAPSAPFVLPANAPIRQFLNAPLQQPAGGEAPGPSGAPARYTYNANDASAGDLDGDGEYEIVLKWDPSNARDTASRGCSTHGPARSSGASCPAATSAEGWPPTSIRVIRARSSGPRPRPA